MSKSLNQISGQVTHLKKKFIVWRVTVCWPLLWSCRPFCINYTKFRIEVLDPAGSGSLLFFPMAVTVSISSLRICYDQGRLPGAALSARPAVSWYRRGIPQVSQQRHTGEELLRYQPSPPIGRGVSHVIEIARVGNWRQIIFTALRHFSCFFSKMIILKLQYRYPHGQ